MAAQSVGPGHIISRRGVRALSLDGRRVSEARGRRAEVVAELLLRLKGYTIVDRRFKTRVGEVDLIARRGNRIAFVEVKYRADLSQGWDALTDDLCRRVTAAGDVWLQRFDRAGRLQPAYDLVLLAPWSWPRHIRDAFPFS
jgi:putative endonuclease